MQDIDLADGNFDDNRGDKSPEMKKRGSIVSILSENNFTDSYPASPSQKSPDIKKATDKVESEEEVDDFVPSKHFDFRFSREQLLDIKRGEIQLDHVYLDEIL